MTDKRVWTCKIGFAADATLPEGADGPMRQAVKEAYTKLTGKEPLFCFSGWGGELDEIEQRIVENKGR